MNSARDYETERRARETQEQRAAARVRLTVRGVARLIGGRYLDADADHSGHTIELAPTVQLWARRDWQRKDMIHWGTRCPRAARSGGPSVCTALGRAPAAIAADLRRRLIPAAQVWCREAMTAAAAEQEREHLRRARLAELEQALGATKLQSYDRSHATDGFKIQHDELGGGYRGEFRAEVRVHSWHCLLMIARLVAEDARVTAAGAEPAEP